MQAEYLMSHIFRTHLAVLGFFAALFTLAAIPSKAEAQAPGHDCRERTVAGERVLACPGDGAARPDMLFQLVNLDSGSMFVEISVETADLRSCEGQHLLGRNVIDCSDGVFEWHRLESGRLIMQKIVPVDGPTAERLMLLDRWEGYPPPYGNRFHCAGRRSTIGHYYTDYCQTQREYYDHTCRGQNAYRYEEVCRRWREGTYGRRY